MMKGMMMMVMNMMMMMGMMTIMVVYMMMMMGMMTIIMVNMMMMIMRRRSMTIRTHCFLAISQGGRVDFESPDASGMEEEGMRLANLKIHVSIV